MPGLVEDNIPSYISSQSADVILSDVRPFKLKTEALHAINVLLDEFLYKILNNAGSLSTDRLRASLLGLLPTSLGKEALLEAEVELRAYWDRTAAEGGPTRQQEDDSQTFHLQWSFELLRLKCEAYSTLNESDEDPSVEDRIEERFMQAGAAPPSATLLAPAALYLTAILEAMCEHILTNMGRVAARDSSRVSANVNDLFTALCEDDSIYGLFRSMRVYEQVELLSKGPAKSRRSKSFTRSEMSTTLTSRTGSPHQELSSGKESISITRSRLSSEVSSSTTVPNMPGVATPASRTSMEKARSLKMFKNSLDNDIQNGHKKSESLISEKDDGQRSLTLTEESVLQQEFDDLMRSSATMKVSLTPDRLRTMEVHKQEKEIRSSRKPPPLSFQDSDLASSKRPPLRQVESIVEDESEVPSQTPPSSFSRIRHGSAPAPVATGSNRTRTTSASNIATQINPPKHKQPPPPAPSAYPHTPRNMTYPTKPSEPNGFPTRTRKRQGNRESLDLDDVMGGSDDGDMLSPPPSARRAAVTKGTPYISAATRELVDFLAQGPPEDDFLNSGPPSSGSLEAKPKGDRLRRMISKLSIGNGDKSKNGSNGSSKSAGAKQTLVPTTPRAPRLTDQNSLTGLSSLANRPIPPRPPRPPSPPSDRDISPPPSPVKPPAPLPPYSPATSSLRSSNRPPSPALIPPRRDSRETSIRQHTINGSPHSSLNGSANVHVNGQIKHSPDIVASKPPPAQVDGPLTSPPNWKAHPQPNTPPTPVPSGPNVGLSPSDVAHLYRLMHYATSADECRLLLHMMLARHKIPLPSQDATGSTPDKIAASPEDATLERSVVGYFLGEEGPFEIDAPRVTPNTSPRASVASDSVYDDDGGADAVIEPPTSIRTNIFQRSIDHSSDSNTLVGEMTA